MNLPAGALAAAFAWGIAPGRCPPLETFAPRTGFSLGGFILAAVLIAAGILLTGFRRLALGASIDVLLDPSSGASPALRQPNNPAPRRCRKSCGANAAFRKRGQELQSCLLKVGHHGSKNSPKPDFLAAVRSQAAIISAGRENPYGHPSLVWLERLESADVRVPRTDLSGSVNMLTDTDKIAFLASSPARIARPAKR